MYCRICGSEKDVKYRSRSGQALCPVCHAETPIKIGRAEFDLAYWGDGPEAAEVLESTKREFYADYKASSQTFRQYARSTISAF